MNSIINKVLVLLSTLRSYLPTKLPVGVTEFNSWADSIIALSGRYADEDSLKFALATMVIHADAKHGSLPKAYFISRLRKVAANQVASQIFQDVKVRQAEAQEAAKQQAEATAKSLESDVASNEHQE